MFVRFRELNERLLVSACRSRRVDGKTQQEHIAQLGSVALPMTAEGRLAFWQCLYQKLSQSVNGRFNIEDEKTILNDICARIPLLTASETKILHAVRGQSDIKFWNVAIQGYQLQIAHCRKIKADLERKIKKLQREATKARSQIARIEKAVANKEAPPALVPKELKTGLNQMLELGAKAYGDEQV
jgi:hypothetical protein